MSWNSCCHHAPHVICYIAVTSTKQHTDNWNKPKLRNIVGNYEHNLIFCQRITATLNHSFPAFTWTISWICYELNIFSQWAKVRLELNINHVHLWLLKRIKSANRSDPIDECSIEAHLYWTGLINENWYISFIKLYISIS